MTNASDYAFLHGGGQGSWVWDETLAALSQQTGGAFGRAIALDAPGCGRKRSREVTKLSSADVAAELVSELSQSGLKDIVLVGHSNAGTILPRMVEMRPDLFRRVVYVTCIAPLFGQSILQLMGTGRQGSNAHEVGWPFDPGATPQAPERFRLMFCNDMSQSQSASFLARLGQDQWPTQAALHETDWRYEHLGRVPSTYVVCLKDRTLPMAWQETFAARFKVQRTVRIDAGHQVMNTRPRALAEILRHEATLD